MTLLRGLTERPALWRVPSERSTGLSPTTVNAYLSVCEPFAFATGAIRSFPLRSLPASRIRSAERAMADRTAKARSDARVISDRGAREQNLKRNALQIRLIPKPLFGKNLRTALGQHRWRKLRQSFLPASAKCQICGNTVRHFSDLNAHEEWSYVTSSKPGVAKLKRISFVCD